MYIHAAVAMFLVVLYLYCGCFSSCCCLFRPGRPGEEQASPGPSTGWMQQLLTKVLANMSVSVSTVFAQHERHQASGYHCSTTCLLCDIILRTSTCYYSGVLISNTTKYWYVIRGIIPVLQYGRTTLSFGSVHRCVDIVPWHCS